MSVRLTGAVLGAVAVAAVLSACDKPLPIITVLAGKDVHRIDAQRFCFDPSTCRPNAFSLPTIRARSGSELFIDVPRVVAKRHWIVTALTTAADGTNTPIAGAGSVVLADEHTVRVDVPPSSPGQSYRVSVDTLDGSRSSGNWSFVVELTS